jgi:hypothetical protein
MKPNTFFYGIVGMWAIVLIFVGCTTSQQTLTFNSISSVQMTSKTLFDDYITAVLKGQIPTNDVPKVSQAYDTLQQAIVIAAVADENGTNALAPAVLLTEGTAFVNLITPYLPK